MYNTEITGKMNRKLIEKADDLLSKERGTVFKDPGGRISIALAYPNTYSVGMSNLGYQGIYGLLNNMTDIVCERVFLPSPEDLEEYERTGTELFSLESKRPLARFDMVAFSVSFENDYPNILRMLRMSRIPWRSSERSEQHPLVVMGGVCAFFNPEPLADFFDICFIGEAEEMLPEFLAVFREARSRTELFGKTLQVEGIYIPRYYEVLYDHETGQIAGRKTLSTAPQTVKKRTVGDISEMGLKMSITTPEMEFSDMFLVEAMRGCPWSCRFCVAGHIYKPVRKKDLVQLKNEIVAVHSESRRVGLIGPSLSDYPHAEAVLSMEGVDFSITSLRASMKSGRLVALLKNHKSVSIAPETGSERLRTVINKKISDSDILETAGHILGIGIATLRLYFMIGLPTETRHDVEQIIELVRKVREINRAGFIRLSVSTFVPKPFTPFQWHPMEALREVKERLKIIKKGLSRVKGVSVFHDVPKYAFIQGVFSLGDRRVSALIEEVASGSRNPEVQPASALDWNDYIFRKKDISESLPWDFIDAGISKERLWREYRQAIPE